MRKILMTVLLLCSFGVSAQSLEHICPSGAKYAMMWAIQQRDGQGMPKEIAQMVNPLPDENMTEFTPEQKVMQRALERKGFELVWDRNLAPGKVYGEFVQWCMKTNAGLKEKVL